MKTWSPLLLVAALVLGEVRPAWADPQRALKSLASKPTIAAAKWQDLAFRYPKAIEKAIAVAEGYGWKPTTITSHTMKQAKAKPLTVAFGGQDLYENNGAGEMLIWDWNDGDDSTGEGVVWVHSFQTGNEETFVIQIAGDSYDNAWVSIYSGIDAHMTQAGLEGVSDMSAAVSRPLLMRVQNRNPDQQTCVGRGQAAGASCLMRAAGDYFLGGLRHGTVGAGIEGGVRAWRLGLSAGLRVTPWGFAIGAATSVVSELIWGEDHHCVDEANQAYVICMGGESCTYKARSYCGN